MPKELKEWMQEHTLNVTSTKTYKYENGEITVEETYTGNELEKKLKVGKTTKSMTIKNLKKEDLTIYSNGKKLALSEGDEITTITTTTVVMTQEYWPFPWWDIGYDYPQYTWYQVTYDGIPFYEKADPINIAWENTYKITVENRIENQGWVDFIAEWFEYVSDPDGCLFGGPGWILGDGIATSRLREHGEFHIRLFDMSNGDIVGAAHQDSPEPHQVIGIENTEDMVAQFFDYDMSNWWVLYDQEELDNEVITPLCDGEATCIWRVGPRS